ncbi:MAG: hypothetical protein QXG65_01160 [Thermoplasmata archaeon]
MTGLEGKAEPWESLGHPASFAVLGLGGAGSDALRDLRALGIPSLRAIAVNTDAAHLEHTPVDRRVLIGRRQFRGRGSGGDRTAVTRALEESREELLRAVGDSEVVFLLGALGGGTGSALLPFLARELRDRGAFPIPIGFLPFEIEIATNPVRRHAVAEALRDLEGLGGLTLLLSNEKLRRFGALPVHRALSVRNVFLHDLIASLVDMVENPSQLNVDLATVRRHLDGAGPATLIRGEVHVAEAEALLPQAIRDSLLDFELGPRTRALLHVEGGSNLTLEAFDRLLRSARRHLADPEELVLGTRIVPEDRELVRLTGMVSGIRIGSIRRLLEAGTVREPRAAPPAR